jgi:hypothetical protein
MLSGWGTRACGPVDGADCMNGSPYELSHNLLCAYHGSNCDGWSTSIAEGGDGHNVIYENGKVQSIVSYVYCYFGIYS